MNDNSIPLWLWVLTILGPVGSFVGLGLGFVIMKFMRRPYRAFELSGTTVELYVTQRRFPMGSGAMIAPTAPDLKMPTGIAKWVRDATANRLAHALESAAPAQPGSAVVGPGARYRFDHGIAAVVMDSSKRTNPSIITTAVANAIRAAGSVGAGTVVVPDLSMDLLQQPRWITEAQRRETCAPIAKAVVQGIVEADGAIDTVRLWIWLPGVEDLYLRELEAVAGTHSSEAAYAA
jgi:hypothetical protein